MSVVGYNYNSVGPLITTKQQYDYSNELLNSNDPTLVQELTNVLSQVDSSKM